MIRVRVPATTANLGPGFDTLGLALNMYNIFSFEEIDSGLEILGVPQQYNNKDNLVYKSMLKTFEKIGYKSSGIRIVVEGDIPVSRGLGSSAACIVGGIVGANEIAKGKLSKDDILKIATEIEGHPDNIAPAIFGGLVISMVDESNILYNILDIEEKFKFIALIPDFSLSTKKARTVLPLNVDYRDAIDNVGRVSMLLSALINGNLDLLKYGLKDKLHQPYRGKLIKDYFNIIGKCEELGAIGTYLSGAGPTIMCLREKEDVAFNERINNYLQTLDENWNIKELEVDFEGVKLVTK
jgi:homoserine kinase